MLLTDLFEAVHRAIARHGNLPLVIRDPNNDEQVVLVTKFSVVGTDEADDDNGALRISSNGERFDLVLLIE